MKEGGTKGVLRRKHGGLYRVKVGTSGSHAHCILDKCNSSHNRLCLIIDCKRKGNDNQFNMIIDCKARDIIIN